ncbi:MAG: collagenase-like protease, partial [Bacteroidales bacterium]|nr:collagenase-like protease [Bacteroidales bacterium]
MSRKIELLAPAKNLETGIAAIRHGADAVYIGAENFGARTAASNSMQDIEKLVQYAHQYNAKIYLTLNTLFYDHEIEMGIKTAFAAYEAGVDALIIQDFGLIEAGLPPT